MGRLAAEENQLASKKYQGNDLPAEFVRFSSARFVWWNGHMPKKFKDLTEREILAIAIANEEEDGRIYGEFADALRESYPGTAEMFEEMRDEEAGHRDRLLAYSGSGLVSKFPYTARGCAWIPEAPAGVDDASSGSKSSKAPGGNHGDGGQPVLLQLASKASDVATRELLNTLADEERKHTQAAGAYEEKHLTEQAKDLERHSRDRLFMLQYVQPGLAGLMDGSVSTLAPLFAAAFATHKSWDAFLVGMAASIGAGISMGFAESLSDDGSLTGRGSPWIRGTVTGLMTTAGGLGHTLPFLIPDFRTGRLGCCPCRGRGAWRDQLYTPPLYGYAVFAGCVSGGGWGGIGISDGLVDRQLLTQCPFGDNSSRRIC